MADAQQQQHRPDKSASQQRTRRGHPNVRPSSTATADRPPTGGMLSSSRQEQLVSQDELRYLSPTRRPDINQAGWRAYKRTKTCGNCKAVGHSVMDCLVVHDDGFIHACPICNMGNHTLDSCRYLANIDLFAEQVQNRGNKPPIYTSTDWFQLWVSKGRLPMGLPPSVEFSQEVATENVARMASLGMHNPKTYHYYHPCDPVAEVPYLPPDPLTAPSMNATTAANLSLPPQTPPTPRASPAPEAPPPSPAPPAPEAPQGDARYMALDDNGVTRPPWVRRRSPWCKMPPALFRRQQFQARAQ